MNSDIENIMSIMNDIEYGFKDLNGRNIIDDADKWNSQFNDFYYLQDSSDLLKSKCGVCWDQVELERYLFSKTKYKFETYFIYLEDINKLPSHTFLIYEDNGKYYWFEHSWNKYKGIHEYLSKKELLEDVKNKFILDNKYVGDNFIFNMYLYNKPKSHIKCMEFYNYIVTQKRIEL